MTVNFEPLGSPIPGSRSKRGWLPLMPGQEKLNQISLLLSVGRNDHRIVQVVRTVLTALEQYYFSAACPDNRLLSRHALQTETGSP